MNEHDPLTHAFRDAVLSGDPDRLRALAEAHPEVSELTEAPIFSFGGKALGEAAARCDRDMVDLLIDLGADLEGRSEWENGPYSALHRLVDGATPERLRLADHLASRGAIVDIHAAAGMGRLDRIREILEEEPDRVSEPGPDGATPLHLARNAKVAALLLERGAEIDKRCVDHRSTPAMWAAGDREDVMRFLLERGATPDLFQAVILDDVELARSIVARDPAALTVRVRFGESHEHLGFGDKYVWGLDGVDTPLELARVRGADRTYAFLLARSPADVRLLQAGRREDVAGMQEILAAHPELLAESVEAGGLSSTRTCEILYSSAAGAREFLTQGADPNARDDSPGATALHHAAWRGHTDLIEVLLDGGANPYLRDHSYDSTPLGWAHENDQREIMELLLERNPADIVDAAWLGDAERVRAILSKRPDLVDGLAEGRISALRSAAWHGHEDVVRVLLEHGADPSLPNQLSGRTALDFAIERGHEDIADLLRRSWPPPAADHLGP